MAEEHGANLYSNGGCHCEICTTAHRNKTREARQARRKLVQELGHLPEGVEHGNSAYTNWGCRCPICFEANRETKNRWSARRSLT